MQPAGTQNFSYYRVVGNSLRIEIKYNVTLSLRTRAVKFGGRGSGFTQGLYHKVASIQAYSSSCLKWVVCMVGSQVHTGACQHLDM